MAAARKTAAAKPPTRQRKSWRMIAIRKKTFWQLIETEKPGEQNDSPGFSLYTSNDLQYTLYWLLKDTKSSSETTKRLSENV